MRQSKCLWLVLDTALCLNVVWLCTASLQTSTHRPWHCLGCTAISPLNTQMEPVSQICCWGHGMFSLVLLINQQRKAEKQWFCNKVLSKHIWTVTKVLESGRGSGLNKHSISWNPTNIEQKCTSGSASSLLRSGKARSVRYFKPVMFREATTKWKSMQRGWEKNKRASWKSTSHYTCAFSNSSPSADSPKQIYSWIGKYISGTVSLKTLSSLPDIIKL